MGHIPKGFEEPEMRKYFSQFGEILRLKVSRNPRTGRMRHYGFIEFADKQVAQIVAETHKHYHIFENVMECRLMKPEEIHPDMWKNVHHDMKRVPWRRIHRQKFGTGANHIEKRKKKIQSQILKRKQQLAKMGITDLDESVLLE